MSEQMTEKKPGATVLAFGFSKTKKQTSLVKSETAAKTFGFESKLRLDEKVELITSIEGKKVKPAQVDLEEEKRKKPLVIPCQKNVLQIVSSKSKEVKENKKDEKKVVEANPEDLEAIQALLADSLTKKKEKEDQTLSIPIDEVDEKKIVEEPDYEAVGVEQFGLAALRGMGWNEKEGIGLTNKRLSSMLEPELRPKGLGLGAGMSKKPRTDSDEVTSRGDNENTLRCAKNAYIQITVGKNKDDYGQIVGFDNGLDRIIIKLAKNDQTVSALQSCTRLVSKSEFLNATSADHEKKHRRK